jgi:hypothetical protein
MSAAIRSYDGTQQQQQSETPLPTVAARAAREAIHAAGPATVSIAHMLARLALTGTIMVGLASLFAALVASTLH